MRFYHSYYAYDNERWGLTNKEEINSFIYGLSAHYIKKLGHEIVLYCNGRAAKALKELPYNAVYQVLDDIDPKSFWAYGKMIAHSKEPLGAIHIDGDVIIKGQKTIDFMERESGKCDMFVQHLEGEELVNFPREERAIEKIMKEQLNKICPSIKTDHPLSFHCGLLRLNNQKLKDKYLQVYFNTHKALYENGFENFDAKNKGWTPDLILEQAYLYDIVKFYGYSYNTLFSYQGRVPAYYYNKDLGYRHYASYSKIENIERIRNELKDENPKLYQAIVDSNKANKQAGVYNVLYD